MNPNPHCIAQRSIDHLVAFDQPLTFERFTHHDRLEMITAARGIPYFYMSAGQALFD
jgi:hypothetical protein